MPRIGEREMIRLLTGIYGANHKLPLGYEDDIAAIPILGKNWMILKSDMLVGSTDVPRGMSFRQAARKAIVATVSDFAAKGVRPQALMVSLGLPPTLSRNDVSQIGHGLADGSEEYGCRIIGGDTGESRDLTIDCMGAGITKPSTLVRRSGARPGDIVAVTGRFGNASAGLRLLLSGRKSLGSIARNLAETVLQPRARLDEGVRLAEHKLASASIDSSDGLAWSLHEIARCSKVSIGLDSIPVAREAESFARQNRVSPVEFALYGGEEDDLLGTVKPHRFGKTKPDVTYLDPIRRTGRGGAVPAPTRWGAMRQGG